MELVPLIFTVLQIVAVLTVLAILFSYVSYKIKQKHGEDEYPVKQFVQPIIKVEKSVKHLVQRITRSIPSYKPHSDKPIADPKVKKNIDEKQRKEVQIKKSIQKKSEIIPPKFERLEVVQNLAPKNSNRKENEKITDERKKEFDKKADDKKLESLGDQILDKYAEDEDKEMYTLKTKKNSSDKK